MEEKKGILGKGKMVYTTQILPIHKFMQMNLAKKKAGGVVIQEIVFPKMTLLGFVL